MGDSLAEGLRENDDADAIDLRGIGRALSRRKNWIIGTTLAALLGSVAFVSLVKARYTAEAKVLIENQENYFTRPDKAQSTDGGLGPDPEAVLSQVQLIQSRDLARTAIRELDLVGKKEFDPQAAGGGFLSRVSELLGFSHTLTEVHPEDRVFDTYFADLTVFPVPKSRVVSVEFVSNDPELSARAANTISDLYINIQSKAKRDSAQQVAASLEGLISQLRLKLAESESRAEKFRLKSGLLVGANNLTITAQQLTDINTQLTSARSNQAEAQAKSRMIREMLRAGRLSEVPDIASNDLVRKLNDQLATLRGQLALETRTLLPGHPRVKELTAQVNDLENQLRRAADKTARTLENDARIAGSRVENLQATMDAQKKVAGVANSDDVTQREFDSESRLLKDQLEANTAKYQEALARQNAVSTPADARVISRAVAPSQATFPKKIPIILMTTLAGLVFSAGSIVAGQFLSGGGQAPAAPLPLPLPQQAPDALVMDGSRRRRLELDREDEAAAQEDEELAAARALAETGPGDSEDHTSVEASAVTRFGLADNDGEASIPGQAVVSLVACPSDPFGAAPVCLALARDLATRHRTILVNLDCLARELERLVKPEPTMGLVDLLAGRAAFAEVIHRDANTRLHVLPHGSSVVAAGEGLEDILDALCETYDQVVLAVPPMVDSTLAVVLAPYCDHALLVTDAPASPEAEAAHVRLGQAGCADVTLVGSAHRFSDPQYQRAMAPAE